MDYIFDSYGRNKKYLFTFLVLSICTVVIYTGRLIDFPKIGVLFFVVFAFSIFLLPKRNSLSEVLLMRNGIINCCIYA